MKKLIVTIAAFALSAVLVSAQDLATVTETFNNGAAALSNGEKASALEFFQQALTGATALGDAGAEVANNCKNVIPNIFSSIAKDFVKDGDFDSAIAKLKEGVKFAESIANEESKADLTKQVGQFLAAKGANLLKDKKFAEAAAVYKEVLEAEPANGNAALRLGMALANSGDAEGAEAAYKQAAENGQEASAKKQLGNLALKAASASLKAKDYTTAIAKAVEATEYTPNNATAYKIAGTAANLAQKKAEAITYLSKYVELAPNAADAAQIKAAIAALKK